MMKSTKDSLESNLSPGKGQAERQAAHARRQAWLASLLMRRESSAWGRLAAHLQRLRAAPRPWRRRLRRQLAATLTGAALLLAMIHAPAGADPTATMNVVNGEVVIANNGKCSLREAIINANNGAKTHADCPAGSAGADTIELPTFGEFVIQNGHATVYSSLTGLPLITSEITVNGHFATIRRDATTKFRLIAVNEDGILNLNHTILSNGHSSASGGAIFNHLGDVKVLGSTLSGNQADWDGGGISLGDDQGSAGYLRLDQSVLEGNSAGSGGAIHTSYGSVVIRRSMLSSNSASVGGGVFAWEAGVEIDSSTLDNNEATFNGGGIELRSAFTLDVVNSTVSGNVAGDFGGGIDLDGLPYAGYVHIINSTITENHAGRGGGIDSYYSFVTLQRSMVTGNSASGAGPEIFHDPNGPGSSTYQVFANRHNLFGHSGNSGVVGFTPGATDIVPSVKPLAIRDSTLTWNHSPHSKTHRLVAGSPALDAAPNADCNAAPINGVDQGGAPRNQNGKGGASANECDIGAYEEEMAPPPPPKLYVSPTAAGNVSGIAARPEDILAFDLATETWAMHFDGSSKGLNKPLSAFTILPNGHLLLSFKVNASVPGVGTVTPWDVVRFVPTSGTFQWYIDGSDVGLTAAAEKIDALDYIANGQVLISTSGALSVPKPGGGTLKMQDEDLAAFTPTTTGANTAGTWALYFNGTAIPGMKAEDVAGAAVDFNSTLWDANDAPIYVSFDSAFNVDGVSGDAKDVVRFTPVYGGWKIQRIWRGPSNGFNLNLAGIDRQ